MEQKENAILIPSSSLFAIPSAKPVAKVGLFKKPTIATSDKPSPGTPAAKGSTENGFKTPLKQVQSNSDIGCLKNAIQDEMAAMNIEKPFSDQISKSVMKPAIHRNMLFNKINTPASAKKAPTNFSSTFKYDPKCVTGIPWIKPKKTTIPEPFKFASDQLAAKRAAPK